LGRQLAVPHRQIDRPHLNDNDRTLLGAFASALPRPATTPEIRRLIRRLASENPTWGYVASTANSLASAYSRPPSVHPSPTHTPNAGSVPSDASFLTAPSSGTNDKLERLIVDYIDHYNNHRPHRSLDQQPPLATKAPPPMGQGHLQIVKSARCDGLVHEYRNAA
jgi:hypothetical protein